MAELTLREPVEIHNFDITGRNLCVAVGHDVAATIDCRIVHALVRLGMETQREKIASSYEHEAKERESIQATAEWPESAADIMALYEQAKAIRAQPITKADIEAAIGEGE